MKKITAITADSAGNKAYHLDQMRQAGLPVPAFEVFSYDLFARNETKDTLEEFQEQFDTEQVDIEQLSQNLKEWAHLQFEQEDMTHLLSCFSNQPESALFSVRSSATIEDAGDASFAGQFHSSLYQKVSDLPAALLATLQSLFDPAALTYVFEAGWTLPQLEMVTIIQEMKIGEVSGIYFTANPQGLLSEHVVVVGEGDGSLIVEDRIETSMTIYHPLDDLSYSQGSGARLTAQQFEKVKAAAIECMALFGPYLDIEFTFVGSDLFLLQARAITTLSDEPLTILDNSNIVESYPGISSPLTVSFVEEAYTSIFRSLAKRLLKGNQQALTAYEPTFQNMVTSLNSRMYYQISSWYQLLQILPFSSKLIPIWQDMLGVEDKTYQPAPMALSKWQHIKTSCQLMKEFATVPRQMAALEQDFARIEAYFRRSIATDKSPQALYDLFLYLKEEILERWDITLLNDLYAFVFTGLLKKRKGAEKVQSTIAGISQIESMKPVYAMAELADLFQALSADEQESLLQLSEEDCRTWLVSNHAVAKAMRRFIDQYGDRVPEELKLETKTFRTHPHLLVKRLSSYLGKEHDEEGHVELIPSEKRSFLQDQAMKGIRYRESSRLNRTKIYGMMRELFLVVGSGLVERGQIEVLEDIYYLTYTELFDFALGRADIALMQEKIGQRKWKFSQDTCLPAFSRHIFVGSVFERQVEVGQDTVSGQERPVLLQGIGCSKGSVQAQVVVVDQVDKVQDVAGKIIVTKMTDPGWVYLLTQATGIVAEKGSLLSHTAIISRELGIPSVVGVKHATQILRDGDWVELDGLTGRIQILEGQVDE